MKLILFLLIVFSAFNSNAQNSFVFIELFTSQGDETSPVAEEILYRTVAQEKKNGTKIVVLEYHVDYWNRLGWKDPLSKFHFTKRQENYSRVLAEKELYTPEVVINGTTSFSGTKEITLKEEIKKASMQTSQFDFTVSKDSIANDTLYVSYKTLKANQNAVFRFAITENAISTKIDQGENANKTLINNYVVRVLHSSDGIKQSAQVKIPVKGIKFNSNMEMIAFVQSKQSMKILGVKELK
ncbi:MAG: DUF1223 domain-containing protein [Bacteroidia bacterium]|nr:DUF1223 domain-containing protein [Bacteroidia bacterium]